MAVDFHYQLERFLGLCTDEDTHHGVLPGQSPDMLNFKITKGYGLECRKGYASVFSASAPLRGIWAGQHKGKELFCAVVGEKLYVSENGFDELEAVPGTVPGTERVQFVPFHDGLYLLTGQGIRKYEEEVVPLEPHIPLVMISTPPNGRGVPFEEPNILTPYIRQTFSPDGDSTKFYPAVPNVDTIEWIKVNGVLMNPNQYNWLEIQGCIYILNAPEAGTDTVEVMIKMLQEDASDRIQNCRFAVGFGGANDTRVFLYGNRESPMMRYHSGVVDGKPSFSYFPENAYAMVGSGSPITSIVRHYDRLLIFTENAAYYSYLEYMTGESGKLIASFPIFPLSDERGCSPEGQALLVENTPCTLCDTGLFLWQSTNIRDERNAKNISDSIARALQKERAQNALLFHRKSTSELFLCFDHRIYVYHCRLKLFYYYEIVAPGGFAELENELFFYSGNEIFRVEGTTDGGEEIPLRWTSGFLDFSSTCRRKKIFSARFLGSCSEPMEWKVSFGTENGWKDQKNKVEFLPSSEEAREEIRLSLKRLNLFKVKLESTALGPASVKGIHIKGRMTDET